MKLNHERVEIDRVPIGCPVDAIPPVRQEGETTILPVVEEIAALFLKKKSASSAFMFRNAIRKLWSCGSRKQ